MEANGRRVETGREEMIGKGKEENGKKKGKGRQENKRGTKEENGKGDVMEKKSKHMEGKWKEGKRMGRKGKEEDGREEAKEKEGSAGNKRIDGLPQYHLHPITSCQVKLGRSVSSPSVCSSTGS